jgi:hypothetical protein
MDAVHQQASKHKPCSWPGLAPLLPLHLEDQEVNVQGKVTALHSSDLATHLSDPSELPLWAPASG